MRNASDRKQDHSASLDACLGEIRKADESVRATTRRLGELRRAYALDNNGPDRINT